MNARSKILILALVQVGTILGWAGYHERLWQRASTFRIALNPVDPYDVLRGRYFILNPRGAGFDTAKPVPGSTLTWGAISASPWSWDASSSYSGSAQVGFCPAGPLRTICALTLPGSPRPPAPGNTLWALGKVEISRGESRFNGTIDLGLDRFFLPNRALLPAPENAPGWELEVVHRPGLPLLPKRLWFRGKPVAFH